MTINTDYITSGIAYKSNLGMLLIVCVEIL